MSDKKYKGYRELLHTNKPDESTSVRGKCVVEVDGMLLDSVLETEDETDSLFEWGYKGTYPLNLAKSILEDYFEEDSDSIPYELIQGFLMDVVSQFEFESWEINAEFIKNWAILKLSEITETTEPEITENEE